MNIFLLVLLFMASSAIFVLVTAILKTLYTVRTYTAGVVERFGKFNRIVRPGLHVLVPFAERVFFVDLQVKQAQFSVETKTHDNVFVQIPVSVQYQVLDDKVYDAFYKLSAPQKQIESFVFNSILGHVPKLSLDETFEQQSGISVAVKTELDTIMSGFGFNILTALVTDIIPDVKVKAAMNDINAAQRAQVAAQARGEAEKTLKVKQAEAEAQSKALQGQGIAAERQAIIDGLRSSIEHFRESVPGATAEDVMALVLLTQYFDTLKDIGTKAGASTIFLPNNPGAANEFLTQILAGLRGSKGSRCHSTPATYYARSTTRGTTHPLHRYENIHSAPAKKEKPACHAHRDPYADTARSRPSHRHQLSHHQAMDPHCAQNHPDPGRAIIASPRCITHSPSSPKNKAKPAAESRRKALSPRQRPQPALRQSRVSIRVEGLLAEDRPLYRRRLHHLHHHGHAQSAEFKLRNQGDTAAALIKSTDVMIESASTTPALDATPVSHRHPIPIFMSPS